MRTLKHANTALMAYARCMFSEAGGNPVRALHIASGLTRSRLKLGMGPVEYSLFRFAHTPEQDWTDYISDNLFFSRFLQPSIPEDVRQILSDKLLSYQYFLEHDLPTPQILCFIGEPSLPASDRVPPRIESLEQWRDTLDSAPPELFVKTVEGMHGRNAFIIRRSGRHFSFGQSGGEGSLEALYAHVVRGAGKGATFVVQPRIQPHPDILNFSSPGALATARIITTMVNNKPKATFAWARLPVGTNITDDFSLGSSGNLVAAINIDTGILSKAWGPGGGGWPVMRPTSMHPDTGHPIEGAVFPLWRQVVDLALQAQASMPGLKSNGWDIAATEDGVTLIEGDPHYDVNLLQLAHQRGLRRELTAMMEDPSGNPTADRI